MDNIAGTKSSPPRRRRRSAAVATVRTEPPAIIASAAMLMWFCTSSMQAPPISDPAPISASAWPNMAKIVPPPDRVASPAARTSPPQSATDSGLPSQTIRPPVAARMPRQRTLFTASETISRRARRSISRACARSMIPSATNWPVSAIACMSTLLPRSILVRPKYDGPAETGRAIELI